MCGQKQSFRKIFAQGSGKECRLSVQKLNRIKGCVVEQKDEYLEPIEREAKAEVQLQQQFSEQDNSVKITSDGKWKQFISPEQGILVVIVQPVKNMQALFIWTLLIIY